MKKYILCGKLVKRLKIDRASYPHILDANYYIMEENHCAYTRQRRNGEYENMLVFVCENCDSRKLTPVVQA